MSSVNSKREKRKNKKKYFQSKKQKTGRSLEVGLKGFLITCNNESQCVREAYNLLNEFADTLFGVDDKKRDNPEITNDDEDVEDQLAKEIKTVKEEKKRFQQMSTKVKGIIFIQTTVNDPVTLVNSIFDEVLLTRKKKARYILRCLPVIETCKATEEEIKKSISNNLTNFVSIRGNKSLSYKIEPKIRHNSEITSSHIFWYLRGVFEKCAPHWQAIMKDPDVVVSVTVLKTVCCISFLEHYAKYKKYNLSEVTQKQMSPNLQHKLASDAKQETGAPDIGEDISAEVQSELTNADPNENVSSNLQPSE